MITNVTNQLNVLRLKTQVRNWNVDLNTIFTSIDLNHPNGAAFSLNAIMCWDYLLLICLLTSVHVLERST